MLQLAQSRRVSTLILDSSCERLNDSWVSEVASTGSLSHWSSSINDVSVNRSAQALAFRLQKATISRGRSDIVGQPCRF